MSIQVKNNIPELAKNLNAILNKAMGKAGAFFEAKLIERINEQDPRWIPLKEATIKKKGSSLAWVDTGELRSLITYRVVAGTDTFETQVGIFEHEKGFIAMILEYGAQNANIPERPLFRPVMIENKDEVLQLVKDMLAAEFSQFYIK